MINLYQKLDTTNSINNLINSIDLPPKKSLSLSSLAERIYEQTIFFSMDNQAIAEKSNQYKDLSWTQKFKIGMSHGCDRLLRTCLKSFDRV